MSKKALFNLGLVVATPGAIEALKTTGETPAKFLNRHVTGDWGDVCEDDANENVFSIQNNLRIMSSYRLNDGTKIWIITEADRSATTILLPSDY